MKTPSSRLPLREPRRLFTVSEIAALAGAVVVVTGYAGHWYAAAPAAPSGSCDFAAGAPRGAPEACLLERVPHPAMDRALGGLLPQAARPAVPAAASRASAGN